MSDKYILQDGKPVVCDDLMAWAAWYEAARTSRERVVRQTRVWADGSTEDLGPEGETQRPDDAASLVSTVFLGSDYNYWGHGAPVLYETMVFSGVDGPLDGEMERYSTRAEAEEGHQAMVARVIDALQAVSETTEGGRDG